jgi:hypothetical protein
MDEHTPPLYNPDLTIASLLATQVNPSPGLIATANTPTLLEALVHRYRAKTLSAHSQLTAAQR